MLFVLGLADRHLLSVSALPSQAIYNLLFHVPLRMCVTYTHAKKRAKVLLFFDMTKKICTFLQKKCNLASIPYNFRACVREKKAYAEMDTLNPLSMSGAAIASICSREILDRCSSGVLRSMT